MGKKIETSVIIIASVILVVVLLGIYLSSHDIKIGVGLSMVPTFSGCTILGINTQVAPETIETGDIVVIDVSNLDLEVDKISHRAVNNRLDEMTISTRGDNPEIYDFPTSVDGFFPYEQFSGKVEHFINLPVEMCEVRANAVS